MCHITDDGTRTEIQTDVFDDLCNNSIELMRYVPENETWIRPDGRIIHGEFIQVTDSAKLESYQKQWNDDKATIEDMAQALEILGVSP